LLLETLGLLLLISFPIEIITKDFSESSCGKQANTEYQGLAILNYKKGKNKTYFHRSCNQRD
jgi:hypothetical protein